MPEESQVYETALSECPPDGILESSENFLDVLTRSGPSYEHSLFLSTLPSRFASG